MLDGYRPEVCLEIILRPSVGSILGYQEIRGGTFSILPTFADNFLKWLLSYILIYGLLRNVKYVRGKCEGQNSSWANPIKIFTPKDKLTSAS